MLIRGQVNSSQLCFFENRFDLRSDDRQAGYNIGDLLNIPFLEDVWEQNPIHHNNACLERMILLARLCPHTILFHYTATRPEDEPVPNLHRIRQAVDKYFDQHGHGVEMLHALRLARSPKTLTVHIRSGDRDTNPDYLRKILHLSKQFDHVLLLSGVHKDESFLEHHQKVGKFITTINKILSHGNKFMLVMDEPDAHLCIMKKASHLLLHQGGFSALGGIVAEGKVFYTNAFSHATKMNWKRLVRKPMKCI